MKIRFVMFWSEQCWSNTQQKFCIQTNAHSPLKTIIYGVITTFIFVRLNWNLKIICHILQMWPFCTSDQPLLQLYESHSINASLWQFACLYSYKWHFDLDFIFFKISVDHHNHDKFQSLEQHIFVVYFQSLFPVQILCQSVGIQNKHD